MDCYEITHERKIIIVSIETFENAARRAGAEKDARQISRAFRKMGFPDEEYSLVGSVTYDGNFVITNHLRPPEAHIQKRKYRHIF